MKLNVVWSPTARSEYSQLLAYIEGEWGLEAVLDFMDATDNIVERLGEFPEMFELSKKKNLRKAVISKHTSLLYRVFEDRVELLFFWDNRQDPEKLEHKF